MASVKVFEDLKVWKKSRSLANAVFEMTRGLSEAEIENLYSFCRSAGELRSQLYRALDRNYILGDDFTILNDDAVAIGKIISKLISYLIRTTIKGYKYRDGTSS